MKKFRLILAVAAAAIATSALEAAAKDICLTAGGLNKFVLKKVKVPKPNGVTSLTAFWFFDTDYAFPCDGSASMNSAGTLIRAGLTCHGDSDSGIDDVELDWSAADSTLAGAGEFDGVPAAVTVVDCASLTLP